MQNVFPHTVTLYNVVSHTDPATLRTEESREITVIRGVLLEESDGSKASREGYTGQDSATVYAPFLADITDGITGETKGSFAYSTDGKTFFIKGEVVEPSLTRQELEQVHRVYSVNSVVTRDYGPEDMKHWQIGGV